MFAHLRGTHGVVLNLIQQGQQGRKLGPPRVLPGCDDSLPYGLPPRPDIQTSLFRNGKPHIWTLQGHCWTVMSSRGQTLRRTGSQMKRSGGAAPVVLAKKKAPARDILIDEPQNGQALQGTSDGLREVQDAWRRQHWPAHGRGAGAHSEGPDDAWAAHGGDGPDARDGAASDGWREAAGSEMMTGLDHAAYGVLRRFSMSSPPPSPT